MFYYLLLEIYIYMKFKPTKERKKKNYNATQRKRNNTKKDA